MIFGPDRLVTELADLGHVVELIHAPDGSPFALLPGFLIPCGRFVGRVIDLALQATPDFPLTVASAIHVRADPQLLDVSDTVKGLRNITNSVLGPNWRYWSHNLGWTDPKTARRLMSKVNRVFDRA